MPRIATRLTDKAVMNAKPDSKPRKLFDGEGLFLLVKPDGNKYWRLKFRFGGKEKLLALGVYPKLTLAAARIEAAKARKLLANGIDPTAERRAVKEADKAESQVMHNTFERVALEWYDFKKASWADATARKADEALRIDLIPAIGSRPIAELTSPEVVKALQAVEKRSPHMADKARQYCGAIVRYAIRTGLREDGRTLDLRDILKPLNEARPATLEANDLPDFLKVLDGYKGALQTRIAIKLLMLTFVRPSELTGAAWAEFDLDGAEWRIPAERMKMSQPHIVPLSGQAVRLLKELQAEATSSPYLFPNERAPKSQPMARDTLSKALRSMGYQGRVTPHRFRTMASTLLNEMGFHPDWIERQLAHKETNKIRAAYNRAQYMIERRRMMQHWSDYLDGMAKGGKVRTLRSKAA
jgi:integrase